MRISDWSSDVCSSDLQGAPDESTIKDTANSVTEPFDGKEVPAKLLEVQGDPYSLAGLGKSAAIIGEVNELDAVLGPDVNDQVDKYRAKKREETAGRVAGMVAGRIILFRGQIGRAHVRPLVTNSYLVCSILLEKKKTTN